MVDNHEGRGIPINELDAGGTKTSRILGHSENCSIPTRVDYFYRTHDGAFKPLPDPSLRPADIARTTLGDGRQVDYVVRLERGTINRFIHGIAMLAPADRAGIGPLERPDTGAWNRKLIYAFQGGVGLGHWQGEAKLKDMLMDAGLSQGYAIAYSTGNVTGTHYNLVLAAETALMLKAHFRILYGKPDYTVGVGGGRAVRYSSIFLARISLGSSMRRFRSSPIQTWLPRQPTPSIVSCWNIISMSARALIRAGLFGANAVWWRDWQPVIPLLIPGPSVPVVRNVSRLGAR